MQINMVITKERHDELVKHSNMLGRIASEVRGYARTSDMTTYECVVAMKSRLRTINKKILRQHREDTNKDREKPNRLPPF